MYVCICVYKRKKCTDLCTFCFASSIHSTLLFSHTATGGGSNVCNSTTQVIRYPPPSSWPFHCNAIQLVIVSVMFFMLLTIFSWFYILRDRFACCSMNHRWCCLLSQFLLFTFSLSCVCVMFVFSRNELSIFTVFLSFFLSLFRPPPSPSSDIATFEKANLWIYQYFYIVNLTLKNFVSFFFLFFFLY